MAWAGTSEGPGQPGRRRRAGRASPRRHSAPRLGVDRSCTDSRGASPHSLCVALKGEHTDGHQFLAEAVAHGATAAIVSDSMTGEIRIPPDLPLIAVSSPLVAIQLLAAWQRQHAI